MTNVCFRHIGGHGASVAWIGRALLLQPRERLAIPVQRLCAGGHDAARRLLDVREGGCPCSSLASPRLISIVHQGPQLITLPVSASTAMGGWVGRARHLKTQTPSRALQLLSS